MKNLLRIVIAASSILFIIDQFETRSVLGIAGIVTVVSTVYFFVKFGDKTERTYIDYFIMGIGLIVSAIVIIHFLVTNFWQG